MGINIGDNNKISKSVIAENVSEETLEQANKNWIQRHPFLSGIIASIIAGFIMLFSFWQNIITFLENLFWG